MWPFLSDFVLISVQKGNLLKYLKRIPTWLMDWEDGAWKLMLLVLIVHIVHFFIKMSCILNALHLMETNLTKIILNFPQLTNEIESIHHACTYTHISSVNCIINCLTTQLISYASIWKRKSTLDPWTWKSRQICAVMEECTGLKPCSTYMDL